VLTTVRKNTGPRTASGTRRVAREPQAVGDGVEARTPEHQQGTGAMRIMPIPAMWKALPRRFCPCRRLPRQNTSRDTLGTQPAYLLDLAIISVDRLLRRPLVVGDAVDGLGPHVLVVEDRELVVLGELNGSVPAENWLCTFCGAGSEVQKSRAGTRFRDRVPAAERALDVRIQVSSCIRTGRIPWRASCSSAFSRSRRPSPPAYASACRRLRREAGGAISSP